MFKWKYVPFLPLLGSLLLAGCMRDAARDTSTTNPNLRQVVATSAVAAAPRRPVRVTYERPENIRPGVNSGPGTQVEAGGLSYGDCFVPPQGSQLGATWNSGLSVCRYTDHFEEHRWRSVSSCSWMETSTRVVAGRSFEVAMVRCLDTIDGAEIARTGDAAIVIGGPLHGLVLEMRQHAPPGRMPNGWAGTIVRVQASLIEPLVPQ